MSCGIYMIKNMINNKKYIGLSNNIESRWKSHILASEYGASDLYVDMKNVGVDNFEFIILENCPPSELEEKELFWCEVINPYIPNGYNTNLAGVGVRTKLTDFDVLKIQQIIIEDVNIKFEELANKFNTHKDIIYRINNGSIGRNKNIKYPIRNRRRGYEKYNFAIQVIDFLKNTTYTINEIGFLFERNSSIIHKINNGVTFNIFGESYPIRKLSLSSIDINEIIDLLKNTSIYANEIAKIYGVSNGTISLINHGKQNYLQDIEYPIRKRNITQPI